MKQNTWLPIFTGYYNSFFDESDHIIELEASLDIDEYKHHYVDLFKAGVTHEFFAEHFWEYADFTKCFNEASRYICEGLLELDHSEIILDIKYEKTVSPKEYNFTNDSINCEIDYDAKKLKDYINSHMEEFKKYLKSKYTSYDGFSSSYSNDVDDWLDFENYSEHELGSVLEFIIENNEDEAELSLFYASNCSEAFLGFEFNSEKCISDFKKKAA